MDPELGREEQLFPCHAALAEPLADRLLVLVGLRRVDVPVAGLNRVHDAAGAVGGVGDLEDAESQYRDFDAVVQFKFLHHSLLVT
jgi:hypothetical protein